MITEAAEKAASFDTVVVFAGLTDYVESEGCDRKNMQLPQNQIDLIDALCATGKKVVVVLFGGGAVELQFADNVSAILDMFLPGQNGGTAAVNLLFGGVSPSGRVAETWPEKYGDVPFGDEFGKATQEIYKESVFVGYRYYLSAGKKVRYPFGYGLSYTTFSYDNMTAVKDGDNVVVTCDVTNTGKMYGGEVVQLYVSAPKTEVFKPSAELRGFTKIYLMPNERKRVTLIVPVDELRYFDIKEKRWILERGEYDFRICSDCQTVLMSRQLEIQGESISSTYTDKVSQAYSGESIGKITDDIFIEMSGVKIPPLPQKFPVTLESRFTDLQQSFMGRILFNAVLSVAKNQMKRALKLPEGIERDNKIKGAQFLKRILESN